MTYEEINQLLSECEKLNDDWRSRSIKAFAAVRALGKEGAEIRIATSVNNLEAPSSIRGYPVKIVVS